MRAVRAAELAEIEAVGAMALLAGCVGVLAARSRIDGIRHLLLPSAAVVAVAATAGSLWFSEVANFPPCNLCWYQRIAMYPLALILTIAAVRHDLSIRPYVLAVAGAGLLVNVWHLYVETFPDATHGGCDPMNPCTIRWVEAFGFWTIPRMAFAAFAWIMISVALSTNRKSSHA